MASRVKKEDAGGKTTPRKRSPSPLPDLHPRITEKGDQGASIKCLSAKRVKRDQSPDLTYIIADSDAGTSNAIDGTETLDRQRSTYQAPEEIHQARNGTTHPVEKAAEPGMSITSEWLLDPAISSCSGMLVMVRGSSALHGGAAWHGGDYEGAQGIVLSVHNTGADNEFFPSTARVKFLKPLHPPLDTFAVPVSLLYPVAPDAAGQQALIVRGQNKGKTAKLWEEVSQGWYVCAAYDYFEVAHEDLVRLLPSAEG
ncbi:hypothetical protein GY45DRAFT_1368203 [Cubamyces sp. BRFM 1775]|nr:hypothetical protein GY45DRAFT_1368203 [Cubamyces sp. BRFM 1775]